MIGGRRGIGAAVVQALAAKGMDVTYTYRTSPGDPVAAARQLDLADRAAVEAFAKEQEAAPAWDAMVQVGGTTYDALAAMMDQDAAESAMQVNFFAFARIARAVVRPMIRTRSGRIVAIGSVIGQLASQGNAAYGATKAALLAYVRSLAIESARRGVTVNYLAPGFVDTEIWPRSPPTVQRPKPASPPAASPNRGDCLGCRLPGLAGSLLHQRCLHPRRWWPDRLDRHIA